MQMRLNFTKKILVSLCDPFHSFHLRFRFHNRWMASFHSTSALSLRKGFRINSAKIFIQIRESSVWYNPVVLVHSSLEIASLILLCWIVKNNISVLEPRSIRRSNVAIINSYLPSGRDRITTSSGKFPFGPFPVILSSRCGKRNRTYALKHRTILVINNIVFKKN